MKETIYYRIKSLRTFNIHSCTVRLIVMKFFYSFKAFVVFCFFSETVYVCACMYVCMYVLTSLGGIYILSLQKKKKKNSI